MKVELCWSATLRHEMIDDSTVRWQFKLFAHPKVLRKIDGRLQEYSEHFQGLSHSQLDTPEWHDLNNFSLYQMQIYFYFKLWVLISFRVKSTKWQKKIAFWIFIRKTNINNENGQNILSIEMGRFQLFANWATFRCPYLWDWTIQGFKMMKQKETC